MVSFVEKAATDYPPCVYFIHDEKNTWDTVFAVQAMDPTTEKMSMTHENKIHDAVWFRFCVFAASISLPNPPDEPNVDGYLRWICM